MKNERITSSDLKLNFMEHEIVTSETPGPMNKKNDLVQLPQRMAL